ncbi:MAG: phosphoribosylformylglycinamidine synthase subunit PurL [Candidatus Helarchaeota archaeon]
MPMVSGVHVDLKTEEVEKVKKMLGRTPNMVEIGMIDIMWSEHCSYKSSRPVLKLLPTEAPHVLIGPGEDAGVIDIGDGLVVTFKIESHNHPSAIVPYDGAATGIGGIVRDILCMGARPIALLDPLRFGSLATSGQSRWLFEYVVKGIGDYGNCIGVPTVGGEVEFDDSFEANCLVNVACVGIGKREEIKRSVANQIGDVLILMGGSTGRDGLGGVTFASRVLTDKSEEDRPAVQIGDPFTKKLIIEATLEALNTGYIHGLKDLGGGGFTCVCSELAGGGGTGLNVDLDKIFLREAHMIPYEIMLSESQERMMFVVDPKGVDTIMTIFKKFEIPHAIVGTVTDTGNIHMMKDGKEVGVLPASILDDVPVVQREKKKPEYIDKLRQMSPPAIPNDLKEVIYQLLSSPNIADMRWVYHQYDHEVGVRSVIKPGQGDAAVLRILNTKKAIAVATDCNSQHTYLDPYHGGAGATAEACRNVVATGGRPLAMVDCLNFGNPEVPEIFWTFYEAVRGIADMCKGLNLPCVGGNVSFYNEDAVTKKAVKPSPVIMVVGLLEDQNKAMTMDFKQVGDLIILLGDTFDELGGSEYYRFIHKVEGGIAPQTDPIREMNVINCVLEIINQELITAAHDCSRGGLAIGLAKMCMKGNFGGQIDVSPLELSNLRIDSLLFSESHSRFILSCKEKYKDTIIKLTQKYSVPFYILGRVTKDPTFDIIYSTGKISCDLKKMQKIWMETIPRIMGML